MSILLKQSTASQEIPLGRFLDSTDGNSQETGLTIANTDIKLWKNGATTLASKNSGGATHIANGVYYCVLDATDTDTLGPLVIHCHPSGALAVKQDCEVVTATAWLAHMNGGATLPKNIAFANFMFLMTDSTNHNPATGLTGITVTRSIDGGSFGAGSLGSVTEVANGIYKVDFAAADLNGNNIMLRASKTGCDDAFERILTSAA